MCVCVCVCVCVCAVMPFSPVTGSNWLVANQCLPTLKGRVSFLSQATYKQTVKESEKESGNDDTNLSHLYCLEGDVLKTKRWT